MCSFGCCGQCCGLMSLFGIFFLFSLGNMFNRQPMYTDVEVWHEHEDEDAGTQCLIAGAIYIVTFLLSVGCVMYDKKRTVKRPAIADASHSHMQASHNTFGQHPNIAI